MKKMKELYTSAEEELREGCVYARLGEKKALEIHCIVKS